MAFQFIHGLIEKRTIYILSWVRYFISPQSKMHEILCDNFLKISTAAHAKQIIL